MTSYFDEAQRDVLVASERHRADPDAFLAEVEAIEERIIADVLLVTGDREFPEDLREKMTGAIAVLRVRTVVPGLPTQGRAEARDTRLSPLIERLHSLFHQLAGRRLFVRFGPLMDSPRQILVSRDEWDREYARSLEDT